MRVSALALALLMLAAARGARASSGEAEAAIDEGIALRRESKDAEALAQFRKAYAIEPTPRALAQIALAEAATGEWAMAEADLLRALAMADPWIVKQKKGLQVALSEIGAHLGTLDIAGPPGAEVWIDGTFECRLPSRGIRAIAKHLVIELRAGGGRSGRAEVDVAPGAQVTVPVALEEAPAVASQAEVAPHPSRVPQPEGDPELRPDGGRRILGITLGAGAGLLAAAGVAFTVFAADRAAHYNDDAACGDLPGDPRSVRCAADASSVHSAELGEMISYGLAGTAGLASLVLLLTLPPAKTSHVRAEIRAIPGGAAARVTF